MVTRIQPMAIVPANISTIDDIRSGFQEIASDLGSVVDQWNSTIYPLIDSLPGGRRRLTPLDRTIQIDPVVNGFDGSQIFLDLTATALINNGILYNTQENRPKTIKEVVLDSYLETLNQIRQLQAILDQLAVDQQAFDDTNLKAWIRRLAADTVSDLDSGGSFGTGYFAGNLPTKTVQYSLHQRDVNLRNLIGIADDNFGLTNPGLSGTNYIDDDTVIQALVDLDTQIKTVADGVGGVASLQSAYDNGQVVELTHPSGNQVPVELRGISSGLCSLRSLGRIDFLDDVSDTTSGSILHTITDEGGGRYISRAYVLRGGLPATGVDVGFTHQQQSAYHSLYDLNPGGNSRCTIHLGPDSSVGLSAEIYATLEGGTRTVADGGGYRWRIYSFDDGAKKTAFDVRKALKISATEAVEVTTTATSLTPSDPGISISTDKGYLYLGAPNGGLSVEIDDDFTVTTSSGGLSFELAGNCDISGVNSTLDFSGTLTAIAARLTATTSGFDLTAGTVSPYVLVDNTIRLAAESHISLLTDGNLYLSSDGTADITAQDDITIETASDKYIYLNGDGMRLALGIDGAPNPGAIFSSDWSNLTGTGIYFNKDGLGNIGGIWYQEGTFADATWGSAGGAGDGLLINTGIIRINAHAPYQFNSTSYGGTGSPSINSIYKENIVKAAGRINVDVSKAGQIAHSDVSYAFNMWVDDGIKSTWNNITSELSVYFRTPMPSATGYSITLSTGHATNILNCRITAQTTTYFKVKITKFDAGSWVILDDSDADDDFNLHFQVV